MWLAVFTVVAFSTLYIWLLNQRLNTVRFKRAPGSGSGTFPNDEELLNTSANYASIDVLLDSGVSNETGKRYLVTGACGSTGLEAVKLLQRRGEKHIFALDITPPPPSLQSLSGVTFLKTDLTSADAVNDAFSQARPDVVLHFASIIRFWERASFTRKYSQGVNVNGTKNIIQAIQSMPDSSDKILVHCSTAGLDIPRQNFARLWFGNAGFQSSYQKFHRISDEMPCPPNERVRNSYTITKGQADDLVRESHGRKGLKTGVLRPGMAICGPRDIFVAPFIRAGSYPLFGDSVAHTTINSQDLALGHLMYEKALRTRPEEVGGDAFLITGDHDQWTYAEYVHALQLFAGHLTVQHVPVILLYVTSHIIEAICFLRYYSLLLVYTLFYGGEPSPHPKSWEASQIHMLQPSAWDPRQTDVFIDDSRVRKVLGYRNKFSNAQTLRWVVEAVMMDMKT